jgi:transposase
LNQLMALVVTAPEPVREKLIKLTGARLLKACSHLRCSGDREQSVTVATLRTVARRVLALKAESEGYSVQIAKLVGEAAPSLLAETGVGPLTAAQVLVSWSHAGRIRNESAFAALAGVAPIPASSGRVIRHRLNRFGDRRLNRALHMVVLCRSSFDPETRSYIARRTAEGKSPREIRRCLKRYLSRRLYRLLEHLDVA